MNGKTLNFLVSLSHTQTNATKHITLLHMHAQGNNELGTYVLARFHYTNMINVRIKLMVL